MMRGAEKRGQMDVEEEADAEECERGRGRDWSLQVDGESPQLE